VSTLIPSLPRKSVADHFFQWSIYLLLVTGFMALVGTGKLDLPSLMLVIPALLLRGYTLLMRKPLVLSEIWTTRLTIVYFAFFAADYFYLSQSFIIASAHMVLFSVVMKIFSVRRDRDLVYLAVLSFLMVLAAVVLTIDTLFLLNFMFFLLAAMATFVSMEIRRSERDTRAATTVYPERGSKFYGSLAGVSAILCVLTLAASSLIFFILPRLNTGGYLRSFGLQGAMATGFSQDVYLGGIGQIQQSNAVVMHIQILSGRLPADPKWRGVTLANFDGQRWWNDHDDSSRIDRLKIDQFTRLHATGESPLSSLYSGTKPVSRQPTLTYKVVMEPLGLNVMFLAPVPLRIHDNHNVFVMHDGSVLMLTHGAEGVIGAYTASSDVRDPRLAVLNSTSRDYPADVSKYLQLPALDPRIGELARNTTTGAKSNYDRAQAVESYLQNNFGYTLELPGAQADPLAHFLFERKKGHCEYFASSMTVMMRALGIPARMVNGFRGGEFNDVSGKYIVRERNAHSWVEVYFPEFGWVTFDPTPSGGLGSTASGWSRVALYLDAARDMWREWIVNYDFSHQVRLSNELNATTNHMQSHAREWMTDRYHRLLDRFSAWERRIEHLSSWQITAACILLVLLLALPFLSKTWRSLRMARQSRDPQRAPKSAASFWYLRMLKRLAQMGLPKEPSQTPAEFADSIPDAQVREDVVVFTEHYERARFAESVEAAERLPELFDEIAGKR
jgi:hypothetical protein